MPAVANIRSFALRAPAWALIAAVLLGATACSDGRETPSTRRSAQPPAAATSSATPAPAYDRHRFAAFIPVPGATRMAVADGAVWVLGAGSAVRIDPATNAVTGEPQRVPANADAIAVGAGTLWVTSVAPGDLDAARHDSVSRVDLKTGRAVATVAVRRAPVDVATTAGAVWVTNFGGDGDSVTRIDPRTNRLAGRPVVTGLGPLSLAAGGGSLWVANHDAQTVTRIDPQAGKVVAQIPVPSEPHRVAYGAGAVWVGNWHDDSVSRIDPKTNRVVGSPIPIGFPAGNIAVGAGSVWVTSDYREESEPQDVVVVRIDPRLNQAVQTIPIGGHPIDIATTERAVWVSVADPGTVLRIR